MNDHNADVCIPFDIRYLCYMRYLRSGGIHDTCCMHYLLKCVTHVTCVINVTYTVSPVRSLMDSLGNMNLDDISNI